MTSSAEYRYCGCGTRLARDNPGTSCAACVRQAHDRLARPPVVPAEFWETDRVRDAVQERHLGHLIAAYRRHPFHGGVIPQATVAAWVGLTQPQLSRIESGPSIRDLDRLELWARTLGMPTHLRWFHGPFADHGPDFDPGSVGNSAYAAAPPDAHEPDSADMNRRDILSLLSVAAAALSTGQATALIDPQRLDPNRLTADLSRRGDPETVEHLAALNDGLWIDFLAAPAKGKLFPDVRAQLERLTTALRHPQPDTVHQRLCELTADAFQLAGELSFDANRYANAAHCYTLAATASREAGAMDLWACAMTRHAYISVFEQRYELAVPLLELADDLASRGDTHLSTRHWVNAVHAQALAGVGDLDGCQRALETAEQVHALGARPHNGGWLRFDGSRLAEDRAGCYVRQRRPDLAEPILTDVLSSTPPGRRRGVTLVDLAAVGALHRDPLQLVTHGTAALDIARQTRSGVVVRKLCSLLPYLAAYPTDQHVQHLAAQIAQLSTTTP
ncbi:helix-turn-helix domain-containing protein [Micromonospora sp. NPDC050417]|uniref:helix-turn-helix domain-containing protein n=1 Tax=Micromonospora sp. NPDC050417 TaxID=3364280 RepID=UPI0037916BFC